MARATIKRAQAVELDRIAPIMSCLPDRQSLSDRVQVLLQEATDLEAEAFGMIQDTT
jgi:hypothetical protein